jgi:hypothetical protein
LHSRASVTVAKQPGGVHQLDGLNSLQLVSRKAHLGLTASTEEDQFISANGGRRAKRDAPLMARLGTEPTRRVRPLSPGILDLDLLANGEGVIPFDPKLPEGSFDLAMT